MLFIPKLRMLIIAFLLSTVWITSSPANKYTVKTHSRIKIGNIDYGIFDSMVWIDSPSNLKVVLSRNFITEPSLYLWARNNAHTRSVQNIIFITETNTGFTTDVKSFICFPVKWSVEKEESGFYEVVVLAIFKPTK